jgi:hypothetical protein
MKRDRLAEAKKAADKPPPPFITPGGWKIEQQGSSAWSGIWRATSPSDPRDYQDFKTSGAALDFAAQKTFESAKQTHRGRAGTKAKMFGKEKTK